MRHKSLSFIILLFAAFLSFTACSVYNTKVLVEHSMPPVVNDQPVIVYHSAVNNLPDSVTYIGTVSLSVDNAALTWGVGIKDNFEESLETEVKKAGGNMVMLELSDKKNDEMLKGKVYLMKPFETTYYTEDSIKAIWKKRKADQIEGIYETSLGDVNEKNESDMISFAIIRKDDNHYLMVYLEGMEVIKPYWHFMDVKRLWHEGSIYAYIEKTEKPTLFKAKKYDYDKYLRENAMLKYDNGNLRLSFDKGSDLFFKIFPDSSKYEVFNGSLTGFALDKNRIVTCYHGVTESDKDIYIKGINGNFDVKYPAVVEAYDRTNDIAILKLKDSAININYSPFAISEASKGTAEEVFVLGYPISVLMGEEIKLTNGIISSTSGAGGDMTVYQISAPIQPGNSGSPLYDKAGNLIGMVNSGIRSADNVGYALKLKYVKEFLTKTNLSLQSIPENSQKDLSLADKVKAFQNSIYLIEIIDTKDTRQSKNKANGNESRRRKRRFVNSTD